MFTDGAVLEKPKLLLSAQLKNKFQSINYYHSDSDHVCVILSMEERG